MVFEGRREEINIINFLKLLKAQCSKPWVEQLHEIFTAMCS